MHSYHGQKMEVCARPGRFTPGEISPVRERTHLHESSRFASPCESRRSLEFFKPAPAKKSTAMGILTFLFCTLLGGWSYDMIRYIY